MKSERNHPNDLAPILEIEDLSVEFQTEHGINHVIKGLSLELKKGEVFAIVGESGCGKSVLCKSIVKLLPRRGKIRSGRINYQGKDLISLSDKELLSVRGQEIAMIFQNPMSALNPSMSVGAQLSQAIRQLRHLNRREAKKEALSMMNLVGIPFPEKRYGQAPCQLSGGMLQRIVISIALAGNPQILIADEPTTALDVTVQAQILNLLNELKTKRGITIFLITHDLGVAEKMADRIGVMYDGRLVEVGTTEEILRDSRHPYTWKLLKCLPGVNDAVEKESHDISSHLNENDICCFGISDKLKENNPKESQMVCLSDTHFIDATWEHCGIWEE